MARHPGAILCEMATIRPSRTQHASGRFVIFAAFAQHELTRGSLALTDEWAPQIARAPTLIEECYGKPLEPPGTDPYARWCGRGRRVTGALRRSMTRSVNLRSHARARRVCATRRTTASTHVICRVLDSACEEVTDHCRDLLRMGLEREVARIEKMDYGTGNYRA